MKIEKIDSNKPVFDLNSYDLIAIDMDNTLVKYNLKNFLPLIHRLIQHYLVHKYNYPKEICDEFRPQLSQKGLIVDKINGNVLKLDSNYGIISAKHGFNELTKDEIQRTYGTDCEEKFKEIPDLLSSYSTANKGVEFYVLKDYFTSPSAHILAKTVDVMERLNTTCAVNYVQIWTDIYEILCLMYDKNAFKSRTGDFFPELIQNPDKYLEKSTQNSKEVLRRLSERGKHVVLITSSNVLYTQFLMNYCFGNEWITYFDCILTFARKPTFFTTDRKFLITDSNDCTEGSITCDDMKCGQIYSEGNWNDFKKFVAKQSSKAEPKCVYIGDSFNDDCIDPNKYIDCHTIAVVEELEESVRSELDSTYWHSFFADNQNNTTLWHKLIEKHSELMVSKFDDLLNYCH